jgi:alanyl-tRNA synthetase
MRTERLYFDDAYLTTFSAEVVDRREVDGRQQVALDRSAFYPDGGGQPGDHGHLNGVAVTDTQSEGELVWHHLAGPLGDGPVTGVVDWARRFDHMQQHHGQHLLSAAFEDLFGLPTLAFHLGVEYASIDLPGEVTEGQCLAAEARVNDVIWEDRPVVARFVGPEELATIRLRKPPTVEGPVRVVSVPDFDHSACGGTHPRSTGAVGLLFVRRRERRGEETRVEFLCGGRALGDLRVKHGIVSRLGLELTVPPVELEEAVERIRRAEKESRKQLAEVTDRWLALEARFLAESAETVGAFRVVSVVRDDLGVVEGRGLVQRLVAEGVVAILGIRGEKPLLVMGRPGGVAVDCGAVVKEVLARVGGRGGGQAGMAQGGLQDSGSVEGAVVMIRGLVGGPASSPPTLAV